MEQVFIRVKNNDGNHYHKDIKDSDVKQRKDYYDTCSKGQIASLLESVLLQQVVIKGGTYDNTQRLSR